MSFRLALAAGLPVGQHRVELIGVDSIFIKYINIIKMRIDFGHCLIPFYSYRVIAIRFQTLLDIGY